MVQKRIKRYKPKRRKNRLNVLKEAGGKVFPMLSSFVVLGLIIIFLNQRLNIVNSKFNKQKFLPNVINRISVSSPKSLTAHIIEIAKPYIGSRFNKTLKDRLVETLQKNFPYISKAEIKYNPVLSKLCINVETHKTLAYLIGQNKFVLENGKIVDKSENTDYLMVECKECIINETNLKILKKFYEANKKPLHSCNISIEKDTFNLICDRIIINWGDEKYFKEKMEKVKYVIDDAKTRIEGGFKIDLRFFSSGRIIVSKL
jgi:hypothetical protein